MPTPIFALARRAALAAGAILLSACDSTRAKTMPDASATKQPAAPAAAPTYPVPDADGKVRLSDDQWRVRLTPEQFNILRGSATERPFSCPLWKISDEAGVYHCAGCDLLLFRSTDKFNSGTGWPSFTKPLAANRVAEKADFTYGMARVETRCWRCDGHLGHVFNDGPPPTGRRYCINGGALRFVADHAAHPEPAAAKP